jgi:hypothetical protein
MAVLELFTGDFPKIYKRFADLMGERLWRQRVRLLRDEIRGNSFLEDLHRAENSIAFELDRLAELTAKLGTASLPVYNDETLYPAASFAAQVLSIVEASDRAAGERLKQRVVGAFKNPADMRALRLELMAATHFLRAGKKVSWPEMGAQGEVHGQGNYDLLIEDLGPDGLEVECKSVSDQRGRRISRRQALDFYGMLQKRHWDRLQRLRTGVLAVLTVSQDLPKDHKGRQALTDFVARAILHLGAGQYQYVGAHLRIAVLEPARLAGVQNLPAARRRELLDEVSGTRNKEVVVVGTRAGGALVLAVQSAKDDDLLESTFDMLADSAGRQFSGGRAAMFVVGLDGLSAEHLLDVAYQDRDANAVPTALRVQTSRFLDSPSRSHLVGVTFLSASAIRPSIDGVVDSGGAAYYFSKPDSCYWSEDFRGLYGREPSRLA